MTSLQSLHLRIWLPPLALVFGTLALRTFLPQTSDQLMAAESRSECPQAGRGKLQTLPPPPAPRNRPHCEHCKAPLIGAPLAWSTLDDAASAPVVAHLVAPTLDVAAGSATPPRA